MNYYFLPNSQQVSPQSEALLNLSGMSGRVSGATPIDTANSLLAFQAPQVIMPSAAIISTVGQATGGVIGTITDNLKTGAIKLGFLWFAFALILLGLIVIAFKNEYTSAAIKTAAKSAAA